MGCCPSIGSKGGIPILNNQNGVLVSLLAFLCASGHIDSKDILRYRLQIEHIQSSLCIAPFLRREASLVLRDRTRVAVGYSQDLTRV